jgi:large subunit ribosomal protein L21
MAEIAIKKDEVVAEVKEVKKSDSGIAIIKTGGKQYKVEVGDTIQVEKLELVEDSKIDFKDLLGGKKVTAVVIEHGRSKKIDVLKFHAKKRYQRLRGHRQAFTKIKIEAIS